MMASKDAASFILGSLPTGLNLEEERHAGTT
jgi:hypothetical protein